ncbi:MAG: cell wall-binding repeat-containing protein [Actinomycetota bacterium]|nr:cell wall-binding repeat-containing protein [Actinomycetota bacterium]
MASSEYVIVATGGSYPDALTGAYDCPILLTESTSLNSYTKAEINRLGASKCFILGGVGAISDTVKSQIIDQTGADTITRLGGADRYETAKKVAEQVKSRMGSTPTAIVVTGENYPDALSAGAYGARAGSVMVLVYPTNIDSSLATKTFLTTNKASINKVLIFGGSGAVSSTVLNQIETLLI